MADFATRRRMMVDTQVRPSDVTKFPIIEAMLSVPREAFVPPRLREAAYVGETLDIGRGRVVLDPRVFAKMLDAVDVQPGDVVLDLGCGLGYSTAVLARLADFVIGVEEDAAMAAEAQAILTEQGIDNASVEAGPLASGTRTCAPFDIIMIEGAVEEVPSALLDQLKDGGRICCIRADGALGSVQVGHRDQGRIGWRFAFNATAPLLPGFAAARAFAL